MINGITGVNDLREVQTSIFQCARGCGTVTIVLLLFELLTHGFRGGPCIKRPNSSAKVL